MVAVDVEGMAREVDGEAQVILPQSPLLPLRCLLPLGGLQPLRRLLPLRRRPSPALALAVAPPHPAAALKHVGNWHAQLGIWMNVF